MDPQSWFHKQAVWGLGKDKEFAEAIFPYFLELIAMKSHEEAREDRCRMEF